MREGTGMHILIAGDEPLREGDEELVCGLSWQRLAGFRLLRRPGNLVRRKLTGWDAVKSALKSEVLGNDREGCETASLAWDCECREDYIHSADSYCPRCDTGADTQPDARKAEVILSIIEEE